MRDPAQWDRRYVEGDLPWDTGRHDRHLEETLRTRGIPPGRALELGCGTGSNAIWLARHGHEVTAMDISPVAIQRAVQNAARAGVRVEFRAAGVLAVCWPDARFDFAFDRGCWHSLENPEERAACADVVRRALVDGGLWLSLIGSADGPQREVGPPRCTAAEITSILEPRFEILELRTTHFDSDQPDPPRAWACLGRKRP